MIIPSWNGEKGDGISTLIPLIKGDAALGLSQVKNGVNMKYG